MAQTKQTTRKGNKGLPKATKGNGSGSGSGGGGGSGGGSGGDSGSGDGSDTNGNHGNGDGKGNAPAGWFRKQLEHRPPPAVHKRKKPYARAFQAIRKLQQMTKLCILKYQK